MIIFNHETFFPLRKEIKTKVGKCLVSGIERAEKEQLLVAVSRQEV